MSKYIVIRTDSDGEAKTCVLCARKFRDDTDETFKITDDYAVAEATRKYLQDMFVECQYDIIEIRPNGLTNWEAL